MENLPSPSVVWITGASRGIGAALARELAQRGHSLILTARTGDALEALRSELAASGTRVAVCPADVTDREAMMAVPSRAAEQLGSDRVDIAIANAGVLSYGAVHDLPCESETQTIEVNVIGVIHTVRAVLDGMRERDCGQIVGISSLAGLTPLPDRAAYTASKVAVRFYLNSLGLELHGSGVGTTVIIPGFIETNMTQDLREDPPFMWGVGKAARVIVDAILARRGELAFPRPLVAALRAADYLPRPLRNYLLRKQTVNLKHE